MSTGSQDYRRIFVQTLCQLMGESPYGYALSEVHELEHTTHVEIILLQPYQYTKPGEVGKVARLSLRIEAKEE